MIHELEPSEMNFFFPEPKAEGKEFGWWKPICKICKTPLKMDISGVNVYWSFTCKCPKTRRL